MRIAVPYEDGNIKENFAEACNFKIYNIENDEIESSEIMATERRGDGVASLLSAAGVAAVVCGAISDEAEQALDAKNIEIFEGAKGSADEIVRKLVAGELHFSECGGCHGGCDDCGEGCGDESGEGCEGCGGGCGHGSQPARPVIYEGTNAGKTVRVHYEGTLDDGSKFDSSYDRGEPLEFVCGTGMMIPGFDKAVLEMAAGDIVNVHLEPAEAYGEYNEANVATFKRSQLPGSEGLKVGQRVMMSNSQGQHFPVVVKALTDDEITLDANHDLAGKALNFKIELVEVVE